MADVKPAGQDQLTNSSMKGYTFDILTGKDARARDYISWCRSVACGADGVEPVTPLRARPSSFPCGVSPRCLSFRTR